MMDDWKVILPENRRELQRVVQTSLPMASQKIVVKVYSNIFQWVRA
jgi:hypothetical protein